MTASERPLTALERAYSPSTCVPHAELIVRRYARQSAHMRRRYRDQLHEDVAYGPRPRMKLDIFVPKGPGPHPVHVFLHGGCWQELSRRESAFAAGNFVERGHIFVAMDYTLAPEAGIPQIIVETSFGTIWLLHNIARYGGDPARLSMSGHSAGAHLLARILSMDWPAHGFAACPLAHALLISGIYDLRPLVHTYINDALGLTEAQAAASSPLLHLPQSACPLTFTVGEIETDAFKAQTADYRKALQAHGIPSAFVPMPGFNHFDVVMELGNPDGPLFAAVAGEGG